MLVIKNIFNNEKIGVIEIDCFFSMPKKGIDFHYINQICIETCNGGHQMWFGYPNGNHSNKIEDREIIGFIVDSLKEYKEKTERNLNVLLEIVSKI